MIRKHLILGILILLAATSSAQQDTTLVYKRLGYTRDPLRSNWSHVVERKEAIWVVSLYNRKALMEKITYEDQKLEVRKGPYVQYYENGNVASEGNFDKGYPLGEWRFYYANKQLAEKLNYYWGKLNGEFVSFFENGAVKSRGRYVMDKKTGVFRTYHQNGQLLSEEYYDEEGKVRDRKIGGEN